MSMKSDPVSIFFKDPTFVNLLEATPSLFTRTLFAVFGLVIKTLRASLILTIFVAIHAIAVIVALLMLIFHLRWFCARSRQYALHLLIS